MRTTNSNQILFIAIIVLFFALAFAAPAVYGHELWVLTGNQVNDWNSRAKPEVYTSLTFAASIIIVITLAIDALLILLHRNGSNELLPAVRARLRRLGSSND